MKKRRLYICLIVSISMFSFGCLIPKTWGSMEGYPSRPIRLICPFGAGGQYDFVIRTLAKGLEKYLKVTVVPDNIPGGAEAIAASTLANSAPDGYTIGGHSDTGLITNFLLGRASFSRGDLRVIGRFYFDLSVLAVRADSPWKTIQEFMDYARNNPGLNYSHPGVYSSPHLRVEYFNKLGNLKLKGVPFKGDMEGITAVLGKHVPIGMISYPSAKPQVDAGKLRILLSFNRPGEGFVEPTIPNLTVIFGKEAAEFGPMYNHLVANGKTPDHIIEALEHALEKVTGDPEFIDSLKKRYIAVSYLDGKAAEEGLQSRALIVKKILKDLGISQ